VSSPACSDWELAQVNVAIAKGPMDSQVMAGFVAALEPINAVADAAPGFVWRLQDDSGDATAIRVFEDDRMLINLSVWESAEALSQFVYRSDHTSVMRGRKQWFETIRLYLALWWVPAGHRPTPLEARERLEHLRTHGPTPYAFTFKRRFEPGDELVIVVDELECPA
jgi:hypothetical protein